MLPVKFSRVRAEELVKCLTTGKSIAPTEAGLWKKTDLMTLAGVAWHLLAGQDPPLRPGVDFGDLHSERREAICEAMTRDTLSAINLCRTLAVEVHNGTYDDHFEPIVEAVVEEDGGETHVRLRSRKK